MSALRDNWTRDADGNYVDWTRPPYRNEGSGILNLLLVGEHPARLSHQVHQQRIAEYYALCRRDIHSLSTGNALINEGSLGQND